MSRMAFGGIGGGGAGDLGIKFLNIPLVETEADADSYVCEFDGGASANEVGVGGGLTGADLILTQSGGVPAASGGGRSLTSPSMYFQSTAACFNAFNMAENLTVIYQCSELSAAGALCYARLANGFFWSGDALTNFDLYSPGVTQDTRCSVGASAPVPPMNNRFWHILSFNYDMNLGMAGIAIKDTLPDSASDFVGISFFNNATHNFTSSTSWNASHRAIIGNSVGSSGLFKIHSLTMSKKPYIDLA